MKWIIGSLITGMLLLSLGCATTTGLHSSTSTVFGIQVDTSGVNSIPSFKFGLIRSEVVTVASNAFPNGEVIKATELESIGFMKNRVHTVLAVGSIAVAQPSVGQPMPHAGISTNTP